MYCCGGWLFHVPIFDPAVVASDLISRVDLSHVDVLESGGRVWSSPLIGAEPQLVQVIAELVCGAREQA